MNGFLLIGIPSAAVLIFAALHAMPEWRLRGVVARDVLLETAGWCFAALGAGYLLFIPVKCRLVDHDIPILGIADHLTTIGLMWLSTVTATIARRDRIDAQRALVGGATP